MPDLFQYSQQGKAFKCTHTKGHCKLLEKENPLMPAGEATRSTGQPQDHAEDSQWAAPGTGDTSIWPVTAGDAEQLLGDRTHRAEHLLSSTV